MELIQTQTRILFTLLTLLFGAAMLTSNAALADTQPAKVNINTATMEDMATNLHGIGEAKATAIVQYRSEKGQFSHTEQLIEVSGIGDKTYARIKDQITVGDRQ